MRKKGKQEETTINFYTDKNTHTKRKDALKHNFFPFVVAKQRFYKGEFVDQSVKPFVINYPLPC